MTDRFSKFARAIPLRTITSVAVAKAFLDYRVYSYGALAHILTDNGSQLTAKLFEFVCAHLGVKHALTTMHYPQTEGQAETSTGLSLRA